MTLCSEADLSAQLFKLTDLIILSRCPTCLIQMIVHYSIKLLRIIHFMFLDCGGVPTFFMIIGLAIAGMWRGLINPNEPLESVV